MIRIKKFTWLLLTVLGTVLFSSCDKNEKQSSEAPEIQLQQSELSVPYEGGTFNVRFTVSNPVEGQGVIATPADPWVSEVFVDDVNGILTFDVAENPTRESRQTVLEVNYPGVKNPAELTVIQRGDDTPLFVLENIVTEYDKIKFDIMPHDKTKSYLINVTTTKDIILDQLQEDEDLFQQDMLYFDWLGSWYGESALDIIKVRAKNGDQFEQVVTNCVPGTEYIVYAYYVDIQTGERLSEIVRFPIESKSVELNEVDFEFEYDVNESTVLVDVTPSNNAGRYYFDMLPADDADEFVSLFGGTLEDYFEFWWNNNVTNDIISGSTVSHILSEYCSNGPSTYSFELMQNTRYYLMAFSVESHAYCSSVPQYVEITTDSVLPSDLIVTPYYKEVRSNNAIIGFTASNTTDSYVAGLIPMSEFAKLGNDEQDQMNGLLELMGYVEPIYGSIENKMMGLEPSTEYVVYAFGVKGGISNTQIFTTTFTTLSSEPGEATVTFTDWGYFDIHELAEIDSRYATDANNRGDIYAYYPLDIDLQPLGSHLYYVIYTFYSKEEEELFVEENPNYYMSALLNNGRMPSVDSYTLVEYGKYNVLLAMAEDSEGRYSEMLRRGFYVTKEGAADPQLFFDFLNQGTSNVAPNYVELPKDECAAISQLMVVSGSGQSNDSAPVAVTEIAKPRYSENVDSDEFVPSVDAISSIRK